MFMSKSGYKITTLTLDSDSILWIYDYKTAFIGRIHVVCRDQNNDIAVNKEKAGSCCTVINLE